MARQTRLYVVPMKLINVGEDRKTYLVEAVSAAAAKAHIVRKYVEDPYIASAKDVRELMAAGVVPEAAEPSGA